jgi:hypothetical protein
VVAYITDALAIRQILEHLDLSPPEKPPPERGAKPPHRAPTIVGRRFNGL